ncbi:class III signal peptide-containing protein [Candidatus Micrarchaeota archaeon]|nr:class III signal peptide-containing protein [Candidatus Micrarchaeota archaeon]
MKRGQGTFEYVLLLGGVLLIVVLAIVVLQNTAQQSFQGTGQQQCSARLLTELTCQNSNPSDANRWNECSQVNATTYPCAPVVGPVAPCAGVAPATGMAYCGTKPLSG